MKTRRTRLLILTILLSAPAVGVLIGAYLIHQIIPQPTTHIQSATRTTAQEPSDPQHYYIPDVATQQFYDQAYDEMLDIATSTIAPVLIVPHHLLAKPFTAGALEAQAQLQQPKTIVVIGPDHLQRAAAPIVTTQLPWKTPYGFTRSNTKIIKQITQQGLATEDEAVFAVEHSVGNVMPFVRRSFPEALVVPLIIQENHIAELRSRLAELLATEEVLIIASIDFSHYQPSEVAQFHDSASLSTIQRQAYDELDNLEIDSPATLAFAFDCAQQLQLPNFELYINENSDAFFGYSVAETTSYIIGGFTSMPTSVHPTITLLAFGDLMFDRAVKDQIKIHGLTYPFATLAGLEERFFRGVDIITGNLEGAIAQRRAPEKIHDFAFDQDIAKLLHQYNFTTLNLANNHSLDQGQTGYQETREALSKFNLGSFGHQTNSEHTLWQTTIKDKRVAMLGFNTVGYSLDLAQTEQQVRAATQDNDLVVVQVHWGEEYQREPTTQQITLGHQFVDWGADIVIGHHPHVIQGIEVYNGAPIFWSLGNAVFDQDFSFDTTHGLAIGLVVQPDIITTYLFPLSIKYGQAQLALPDVRQRILDEVARYSNGDEHFSSMIKRGILTLLTHPTK